MNVAVIVGGVLAYMLARRRGRAVRAPGIAPPVPDPLELPPHDTSRSVAERDSEHLPEGASIASDLWFGPFRVTVYADEAAPEAERFWWILEPNMAAIDEGVAPDVELSTRGYPTAHEHDGALQAALKAATQAWAAEIVWTTAIRKGADGEPVKDTALLFVHPLLEHQRDDGTFYRSWMVSSDRGGGPSLVSSLRRFDGAVFPTEWKIYTREGWPGTAHSGGTVFTDPELWEAIAAAKEQMRWD